jgi:hypothetical protein
MGIPTITSAADAQEDALRPIDADWTETTKRQYFGKIRG